MKKTQVEMSLILSTYIYCNVCLHHMEAGYQVALLEFLIYYSA